LLDGITERRRWTYKLTIKSSDQEVLYR